MNLPARLKLPILTGAWLLASVAAIWLFSTHSLLPDEGQAWLWAQALNDPLGFLAVPGEGHPPLWFATLKLLGIIMDFSTARWFNLGLTILNGLLMIVLLRKRFWLALVLILSSISILFWGVLFRPYALLFTVVLCGFLAEKKGYSTWAGWLLALATGFHFYAQALFGFWLLVKWTRRTAWVIWLGPSVLAALFALSTVLSGQGNAAATLNTENIVPQTLNNLVAGFGMATPFAPLVALLIAAWLYLAFRHDRAILWTLLACLILLSGFTALVYGYEPWHLAFISMLVVLATIMARPAPDDWRIALLLLPWVWTGGYALADSFAPQTNGPFVAYKAISTQQSDIGPDNLVVWPDYLFAAVAAEKNLSYTSANNGAILGPVNWRTRTHADISTSALSASRDYWLVCAACDKLMPSLENLNAQTERLIDTALPSGEPMSVVRVTLPAQSSSGS